MDPQTIELYNRHYEIGWRRLNRVALVDGKGYRRLWFLDRWRARRAIFNFAECLKLAPDMWQCMWATGKAYQALGDDQAALAWFERAASLASDQADVFREAFLSAAFLGDVGRAEGYAKRALELRRDSGSLANYAVALTMAGKFSEALNAAQRACSEDSSDSINQSILRMVEDVAAGRRPKPKFLQK